MVNIVGTLPGDDGNDYLVSINKVSAPPKPTSLVLAADPASPVVEGTSVLLTATVEPANAVGTVSFSGVDDATPVVVGAGRAQKIIVPVPAGTITIGAHFEPANPSNFVASDAEPLTYVVSAGEAVLSGPNFAPSTSWSWAYGPALTSGAASVTATADQEAGFEFSGTTDNDHNAGLLLRSDGAGTGIKVVFDNDSFKIEAAGMASVNVARTPSASGIAKVEVTGPAGNVRIRGWVGGTLVADVPSLGATATGRAVQPIVWQSSPGVSVEFPYASSLGTAPPIGVPSAPSLTGAPGGSGQAVLSWSAVPGATSYTVIEGGTNVIAVTPQTSFTVTGLSAGITYSFNVVASNSAGESPTSNTVSVTVTGGSGGGGSGEFYLGASGPGVGNGHMNAWQVRHLIRAAATWSDVPGAGFGNLTGEYGTWGFGDQLLDVAIGGPSNWAAAAADSGGAYTSAWRSQLEALRAAWGSRDPGKLRIRFAHEFNGSWFDWHVTTADAAAFKAAWIKWVGVLRTTIPGALAVWSPNYGTSSGHYNPLASDAGWPGAAYVDRVAPDGYNQYPHEQTAAGVTATHLNGGNGFETWRQWAASKGCAFAIPELGNASNPSGGGGGGDAPAYFTVINDWCLAHAGDGPGEVEYAVWFNVRGYTSRFEFFLDGAGGGGADPAQPLFAEAFRTAIG